jgi:hypothetical protein
MKPWVQTPTPSKKELSPPALVQRNQREADTTVRLDSHGAVGTGAEEVQTSGLCVRIEGRADTWHLGLYVYTALRESWLGRWGFSSPVTYWKNPIFCPKGPAFPSPLCLVIFWRQLMGWKDRTTAVPQVICALPNRTPEWGTFCCIVSTIGISIRTSSPSTPSWCLPQRGWLHRERQISSGTTKC